MQMKEDKRKRRKMKIIVIINKAIWKCAFKYVKYTDEMSIIKLTLTMH